MPSRLLMRWLGVTVLAMVVLSLAVSSFLVPVGQWLIEFRDWVGQQGAWGPAVFVLVYVACTVCFLPGWILTAGAGALYGLVWGTVLASFSSTMAAAAGFLIARYLARDQVRTWVETNPKFAAIDRAIARRGGWIVLVIRLSPVFPFALLNYALGLTGVRFTTYLLASWVGMLPGTIAYVLLGFAGRQTLAGGQKVIYWVFAAVAAIAATSIVTHVARRAIQEESQA